MPIDAIGILQAVISGVLVGGVFGLFSIGFSMAFGVMRIVNFAHGELVMLGMYVGLVGSEAFGVDPLFMLPLAALLLGLLGTGLYATVFHRFTGRATLQQLLAAVAVSLALQTLAEMAFGPETRAPQVSLGSDFIFLGPFFLSLGQIAAFLVAITCVVALDFVLRRTRWGTTIRAIADDAEVAELVGIDARRRNAAAFSLACALAGIAGCVLVVFYPVSPATGFSYMPVALVATVVGGLGSIGGAFIGGIGCAVIQQLTAVLWSTALQNVPLYVLLIVVLAFFPLGLFGRPAAS